MPLEPCAKNGKSGHKFGESGNCYSGQGSKAKAAEQGRAIKANETRDEMSIMEQDVNGMLENDKRSKR